MLCNAFDQRLDELLDQRVSLASDEKIRSHAEVCPRCRTALRAHQQLLEVINEVINEVTHDADSPQQAVASPRAGSLLPGWMAVAATLLLAANLWSLLRGPRENSATVAVFEPPVERPAELKKAAAGQAVVADPYRHQLLSHAAAEPYLVHQPLVGLRLLSMGDWSTTMYSINLPFGAQIPQVQAEWMDAVAEGISPVQDSFSSTLDLIRRTLAVGRTHQS